MHFLFLCSRWHVSITKPPLQYFLKCLDLTYKCKGWMFFMAQRSKCCVNSLNFCRGLPLWTVVCFLSKIERLLASNALSPATSHHTQGTSIETLNGDKNNTEVSPFPKLISGVAAQRHDPRIYKIGCFASSHCLNTRCFISDLWGRRLEETRGPFH